MKRLIDERWCKMIIILKSGKVIKNIKCLDETKSPIGLLV
jgi:hypothetical protein